MHESNSFLLKIRPLKPLGQWGQTTLKSTPSPWATWIPFHTSVPGPTPFTTPNDISIGSRTSTLLRSKGLIGYNGTPHIHPHYCLERSPPHLMHPSLYQPHSPPQMASGSAQPFCHNTLCGPTDWPTDRQTDRWSRRMFSTVSAYAREWRYNNSYNGWSRLLLVIDGCDVVNALLDKWQRAWSATEMLRCTGVLCLEEKCISCLEL